MRYYISLKRTGNRDFPYEFFHYYWGYLMPSFWVILQKRLHHDRDIKFVFESFGTILDLKTAELADLFSLDYKIVEPITPISTDQLLVPPRWDINLQDLQSFKAASLFSMAKRMLKRALMYDGVFDEMLFHKMTLQKSILFVRDKVLNEIRVEETESRPNIKILKRTTPDDVYNQQKIENEVHRIGTERRSLTNLINGVSWFKQRGQLCEIYQPGNDSLLKQIDEFHNAITVIGIRGAELSNIIWMRPDSKVIVIDNFNDGIGSPCELLSTFVNATFEIIHVDSKPHHELNGDLLKRITDKIL